MREANRRATEECVSTVSEAVQHRPAHRLMRAPKRMRGEQPPATQAGAGVFPQLVWAHYQWERRLHADGVADAELEAAYQAKVAEFQKEYGKLEQVYWSTRSTSAVAMTVKRGPKPHADPLGIRERRDIVRFHRVTDWVTRDAPLVADLLNECDLLANRVQKVLSGEGQQIAMRWILGIAMHLLGFLERDFPASDRRREERQFARAERQKLAQVEDYYHRAASQAGRVIYVSGMLVGLLLIALLGACAAWLMGTTNMSANHRSLVLLCCGAGAIGALVSTLSRMGKPEAGRFNLDFELGPPLVRRLGLFRPFVGGIFGVALFFMLESGLLDFKPSPGLEPYYYGLGAFLAGFSERFATGMLGAAERRLDPSEQAEEAPPGQLGEAAD